MAFQLERSCTSAFDLKSQGHPKGLARGIAPTRTINIVGAILSRLKFLRAKTLASNMVAPVFLWPFNWSDRVLVQDRSSPQTTESESTASGHYNRVSRL